MGGAAGHMAHPFDCREVRNGKDLVNFYVKAVNAIPLYDEETKGSSVSVKLDGVNASFRLQKADNPAGFMFVLDILQRQGQVAKSLSTQYSLINKNKKSLGSMATI